MPSGPWHFLLLSVCLPLACGQISFSQRMVLANVFDTVNLSCHTDYQGPLSWRHSPSSDEPFLEESSFAVIQGKELILKEVDIPSTGIYSCWGEGQKLDQMQLLMEENENEVEGHLSCTALTYSCSFRCSWSLMGFTEARLSYHRDGQNSTSWVYPHSMKSSSGQAIFEFTLNLSSSPFAEESAPLVLTGEAVSSSRYLRRVQKFYLRDIVQPEPPQSVQCKKMGNSLSVTVQPASSWAKPLSYFPLMHQIEFEYKNNGMIGQSNCSEIPREISKLRVRSRDPLVPSPWSQWSPWKNVKKGKGKEKENSRRRFSGENDTIFCKKKKQERKRNPEHKTSKHHKY
ncbi:interleukin-12 subunit beta [Scleropages formosus]|uniref:Interleukin-12 subunit beta n=1 Tax=Scleropages formosus TaxID=113540 RepID=A0A8C9RHX0_SCLFO|nr:interleukin-12 subunit beta-like [Scleropages formosus]